MAGNLLSVRDYFSVVLEHLLLVWKYLWNMVKPVGCSGLVIYPVTGRVTCYLS